MGYSMSVVPQTRELGERMVRFMEKHYRTWGELGGWGNNQDSGITYATRLAWGPLAYDDRDDVIGIDYKPAWLEREYALALLAWVAIKVGQTLDGVPYLCYDGGGEPVKITPDIYAPDGSYNDEWLAKQWPSVKFEWDFITSLTRPELARLTALWESEVRDG